MKRSIKFKGERYTTGKQQNWAIIKKLYVSEGTKKKKKQTTQSVFGKQLTAQPGRLFHTVEADFEKDLVQDVETHGGQHKKGIGKAWRKAGE